jgi:hypothetical protein
MQDAYSFYQQITSCFTEGASILPARYTGAADINNYIVQYPLGKTLEECIQQAPRRKYIILLAPPNKYILIINTVREQISNYERLGLVNYFVAGSFIDR